MTEQPVSINQLTSWAKSISNTDFDKLQTLSNGIVICKILNKIYPNAINPNKIKTKAKYAYQGEINVRLFLDTVARLKLTPPHIKKADIQLGKTTTIIQLLRWLHQRNKETQNSKGKLYQQPKMIKNYTGSVLATKRKIDVQKKQSKSNQQNLDMRRSQTCQPKRRQNSKSKSKVTNSNNARQSNKQLNKSFQIQKNNLPQNIIESLKKFSEKKQKDIKILNQSKKLVLSQDKLNAKQLVKENPQQSLEQYFVTIDPQLLRSKMIKVVKIFADNQEANNKFKQIFKTDSNQQVVFNEKKQTNQLNQSDAQFTINDETQNIQIDTVQSIQANENENIVKIQISPRYKKDSQTINNNQKQNNLNLNNQNKSIKLKQLKRQHVQNIFSDSQLEKGKKLCLDNYLKPKSFKIQKMSQKETNQKNQGICTALNTKNKSQLQQKQKQFPLSKFCNKYLQI